MIEQERTGLDFEALRHATEKRELDFYADDAQAIILNADAPFSPAFELVGKAENSKYLGTAFSQKASHSIEGEVVREDLVEYREVCEYPDGTRVGVATAPARTNRHEVRVTSKEVSGCREERSQTHNRNAAKEERDDGEDAKRAKGQSRAGPPTLQPQEQKDTRIETGRTG